MQGRKMNANPRAFRRHTRKQQQGVVAIQVALFLVVLLGFAALAIDVGRALVVRNELQNAADAAALAGVSQLTGIVAAPGTVIPSGTWNSADTAAQSTAGTAVTGNSANGVPLVTAQQVQVGYWNVTGTPAGLQSTTITPGQYDFPAVQVTVSLSTDGKGKPVNGGPLSLLLAPVLGITSMPISATATAAVATPGSTASPNNLFPLAISQCLYSQFWNSTNSTPVLSPTSGVNSTYSDYPQTAGQPYVFQIKSVYHTSSNSSCQGGEWTPLSAPKDNSDKNNQNIIQAITNGTASGAPSASVGQQMWIENGTKSNLFGLTDACSDLDGNGACAYVMVPVVTDVSPGSDQTVQAFACLHILKAPGNGNNADVYVQMESISTMPSSKQSKCSFTGSGGGTTYYGGYMPPRLVQ
jgi:Flp pilus assembly protein TadG